MTSADFSQQALLRQSTGLSSVRPPRVNSGPPTLVKQDVKYFSPQEVRERECALAVAGGRTNLSELARLNSENEAPLEREKTTEKSPP